MLPQVTQTFIMNSAEIFELASVYKRGFIIVVSRPSSPADRDPARRGSQYADVQFWLLKTTKSYVVCFCLIPV